MASIGPSTRLKLKRDAFVVPDGQGGVYFRNNQGSFQMEGRSIEQWIERLLPVFDGHAALGDLVDGLPPLYQERILEIADVLYKNGFVRDVSTDLPHHLPREIVDGYAGQIELVDTLGSSGAFHFEQYRNTRILGVGHGEMLPSLVSAVLASGVPVIHVIDTSTCITDGGSAGPIQSDSGDSRDSGDFMGVGDSRDSVNFGDFAVRHRIADIADHARKSDASVQVSVLDAPLDSPSDTHSWDELIRDFDVVLYASTLGEAGKLLTLEQLCKRMGKVFAPIVLTKGAALVGPTVDRQSTVGWNSVWHRLHHQALQEKDNSQESFVGESLAANVLVFDLFKTLTNCQNESTDGRFYLLNLETLEGAWYTCLQHPAEDGPNKFNLPSILDVKQMLEESLKNSTDTTEFEWLPHFAYLTNSVCGIFDTWDEGEYHQLPLSVCSVQVVDALSTGPATLLPEQIVAALTHEDARLEAGFLGIEQYVGRQLQERLARNAHHTDGRLTSNRFSGIGCGRTMSESVWRALWHALIAQLKDSCASQAPSVVEVTLGQVQDNACRFNLNVLQAVQTDVFIGVGETLHGLPVVWVGEPGNYYGSVGLNETMALQSALAAFVFDKTTLQELPNAMAQENEYESGQQPGWWSCSPATVVHTTSIDGTESDGVSLSVLSITHPPQTHEVQEAIDTISSSGAVCHTFDAAVEPFLQKLPGGVIAVVIEWGESS